MNGGYAMWNRAVKCLTVVAILVAASGCTRYEAPPRPENPLCLALAYDVSGSAAELPRLTPGHINQVVSLAKIRAGSLAFCLIEEKASPLDRLELIPVIGLLDERALRSINNRDSIAQWKVPVIGKVLH